MRRRVAADLVAGDAAVADFAAASTDEPDDGAFDLRAPNSSRRERLNPEHTTVRVDHRSDVQVAMRVHPTNHTTWRVYDSHGHPFLS